MIGASQHHSPSSGGTFLIHTPLPDAVHLRIEAKGVSAEIVSLELVHDPTKPVTDTSAVNHLVVQTDNLDATIADLAARGVTAEPPTEPEPGLRTAWLTDPDGYRIELVQWPAGHAAGITVADMDGT